MYGHLDHEQDRRHNSNREGHGWLLEEYTFTVDILIFCIMPWPERDMSGRREPTVHRPTRQCQAMENRP